MAEPLTGAGKVLLLLCGGEQGAQGWWSQPGGTPTHSMTPMGVAGRIGDQTPSCSTLSPCNPLKAAGVGSDLAPGCAAGTPQP